METNVIMGADAWERPPSVAETLLDTGLDNSTDV